MNFNSNNKTSVQIVQQAAHGISQISFSTEGNVSQKKPTTLPEVAKQRELSGTLGESDSKIKKHSSDAKCKELIGHDIFGPPPEIPARKLTAARNLEGKANRDMEEPAPPRNLRTSVKVSSVKENAIGPAKAMENKDGVAGDARAFFKHLFRKKSSSESEQVASKFSSKSVGCARILAYKMRGLAFPYVLFCIFCENSCSCY